MTIDKVEVTNAQGNLLTLTLEDTSNGYVVKNIDGLDPVKSSIVTSSFATLDGQQYQASSRDVRNITIRLGYAPNFSIDQTIRALRTNLYLFFMSGQPVALTFYMSDGLTVTTSGRVETCETPIFTDEPQMDISIVCFDPDFIDTNLIQIHSVFDYADTAPHPIVYDGTVPSGLTSISFTANQEFGEFTIYHTTPSGVLNTMFISAPIEEGDVVNICTVKGQKSITRTRAGTTSSLLWAVSPESVWVQLENGVNQFYLYAAPTAGAPVLVDYYNRYGGL